MTTWAGLIREGVKKNVFLGLCPKHRTPPTHCGYSSIKHMEGVEEGWKLESPPLEGVSPVHGGRRPISLEYQINHSTHHI